jgi:transcriptional regulator with XRE-family HTH domain
VKARQGDTTRLALFASELAAARTAVGLSQEALAARLTYSLSLVSMIEGTRRAPTLEFAQRCDAIFGTPGTFVRLQQHSRTTPLPAWFRAYADVESSALQLRSWQPMVIDGLLQTEPYARALLATRPHTSPEELDALVTTRIERQTALTRDPPPTVWVLMDEAALQREVGDAAVMAAQLQHLAAMSERPTITIQILPWTAGAHAGLLGAFATAEATDGTTVGYLDTAGEGFVAESRLTVDELSYTFDLLRADALTRKASREVITKWARNYGSE